ncbi:fimbria/pilus outer membrane usher protein [Variovorax sp. MHTC-1]|uniref:fimbria/pilus outer membrane usher protein n=1 Tax=Variovorax sp. MHTC-1 TaxID=2495593 RepID=UPI000F860359|nr:fimbria/pilus outer membrane usher protein [Variovorax sp. MHTC-1]RST55562.1 fimbrial biogenesis outer membrane usher protein [Variovorax sp. MHTC-1]
MLLGEPCAQAQPLAVATEPAAGTELYLEVVLNQTPSGKLLPFVSRGGALYARVADLRQLGFALAGQPGEQMLALAELPGLKVRFDSRLQRIDLDAPLALLSLATTRLESARATALPLSPTASGLLFNYDLYAAHGRDGSQLSAAQETRLFGLGTGVVSNTMITRLLSTGGGTSNDGWRGESVRLDTSWQASWPESMLTLKVGDSVTGSLGWTRSVRLGGVRVGSDFGLQPYRTITPQPAFFGEVTVPSTVELYVNGLKQYSGQVPTGPFQLRSNPGISGAGNAQIVITDAFGRSSMMTLPFYNTQQLLSAGLTDWSASMGAVRLQYGQRSFSYDGTPVVSASLRRGISDRFTLEAHAEGSTEVRNGGLGGLWLLGTAGVISAAAAYGAARGEHGSQWALGYRWNRANLFLDLNTQRTRGEYRDIASTYGQNPARVSDRASAGVNIPWMGSLGVSYVRLAYPRGDDARYAGLSWSRQFGNRLLLNASLNRSLTGRKDLGLFFGLSYGLEARVTASTSVQRDQGRTSVGVDISSPVPSDGGWGWRAQLRDDGGDRGAQAEAGWLGRYGRANVGIASSSGNTYGYGNASGSLVLMNGNMFTARDVNGAFAVVSTDGVAGVPVKLENRVVGTTDDRGMLLLTRLNAWQRNKLSIDPMDLPANVRVGQVDQNATPSDRVGTVVRFAISPVRAAVIVLHDASGQPLALASRAQDAEGSGAEAIVGYDGEVYLDTLQMHNHLRVQSPEGRACHVRFDYPAATDSVPRIGPLTCTVQTAP